MKRELMEIIVKIRPVSVSNEIFRSLMNYETIEKLLIRKNPKFHINQDNKDKILTEITKYPQLIDKCIEDADKICKHIFDLLGSGETNIGNEIDWHRDFKSGYKWHPNKYYLGSNEHLQYMKEGIEADVKIPWELSRFHHLVTLGKAYWYTTDEKYVQEFIKQINSWIEKNPIELGVNWICTMDVAIRAVNWIWAYYFFSQSSLLTSEFKIKFLKTLYLHGRHIWKNLEYEDVRGNHYLTNIVGLIYLGIFFQESKEAQKWLSKGINSLIEEMSYQVLKDGVNAELSTGYHRLITEIFISTTLLLLKNNIKIPKSFMDRLEKMLEFILYYTKPDGTTPQIGDSDDGRLHILSNYFGWDKNNHQYLLSVGDLLFDRDEFRFMSPKLNEEAFWLSGGNKLLSDISIEKRELKSKPFQYSGFNVMRNKNLYMFIDASSPDSKYLQGHRHNSALSFELFADDKSHIIDPGSYIYTANPKMRNLFRSTKYHNTIQIDGYEQNNLNDDLFYLGTDSITKLLKWEVNEEKDLLEYEHYGYERLNNPVIHKRKILFNKRNNYWIIEDILECSGLHTFDFHLHLTEIDLEPYDYKLSFITREEGSNIAIIPLDLDNLTTKVLEGHISPSYGKKTKGSILQYSKLSNGKTNFSFLLLPFKKKDKLKEILKDIKVNDFVE